MLEIERALGRHDPIVVAFVIALCSFGALAGDILGERVLRRYVFKDEIK